MLFPRMFFLLRFPNKDQLMTFPTNTIQAYSKVHPAFLGAVLVFILATSQIPVCAETDLVSLAEREILKRQEESMRAEDFVIKARRDQADKNREGAYANYLQAIQMTQMGSATKGRRAALLLDFSKAGIDYANWLIENGNYKEAENVAKTILSRDINPSYKPAVQLLANLEQPGYYNRTVSSAFASKRQEVSALLNQADPRGSTAISCSDGA